MSNLDFTATLLRKNSLRKACQELSVVDLEKAITDLLEIKGERVEDDNARAAAEAERLAAIHKIHAKMAELGLSLDDISQVTASPTKRSKVAPQYRLVDDEGNVHEWSGRGRAPKVFKERIEKGATKEDFRIAH